MSGINVNAPSVQKAIEQKKQSREEESINEIKGLKIAREASGDNPHTTSISTSVDTSKAGINQEIEKAEKALDATLPATSIAGNSKSEEKQKKEEESNKAIEENNQKIIASWTNVGSKEGVS